MVACLAAGACQPAEVPEEGAGGAGELNWTPPPLPPADTALPDPVSIITEGMGFVANLDEWAVEAAVTYGVLQESGQVLHFEVLQRVALRRPDQLSWWTLEGDGTAQHGLLSDGQFTLLRQPVNLYGTLSAPGPVHDAVQFLMDEYGLDVPFPDLLSSDPTDRWLGDGAAEAQYVGEEWIQGSWTHHVSVRKPWADIELWFVEGDEPFMARMRVTFMDEEGTPSYTARFRNWRSSLPPEDATFEFTPPDDAQRVGVAPVS
jgi:hypothetical protein